jgi:2-polyprenyl-3-methyl-5-hydroxy-6-metoxy-1,4-benzoquinol methylase
MTTPPVTLQPMPLEVVREPAELEAFLEDALRVCSPGRMLVVGVGAERVVRALLQRGIHTVGLETCQGTQFEDAAFESTLVFGALDGFDLVDSEEAVKELHRVTRGTVIVISAIKAVCAVSHRPSGGWREWWDGQFIGAGFRKHPLRSWMIPSDTLEHDRAELTMIFEPIPEHLPGASMLWDATREVGLASDSWLAGYEIAASHIRPWDVVIDLACGPGGGIHLMRRFSRGGRFIGIDRDAPSIEYARAHFAGRSKNIEFQVAAPVDALLGLGDNSVHFIVCSGDQARTAAESKEWQEECLRVLVPGGRMLLSLATDEIPLWQTTAEKFLVEKVFHFN